MAYSKTVNENNEAESLLTKVRETFRKSAGGGGAQRCKQQQEVGITPGG